MSEKRIVLTLCAVAAAALTFMAGFWLGNRQESDFIAIEPPKESVSAVSSVPSLQEEDIFPISLNKATLKELQKLPGIGEAIAEKIVAYRLEHGFTMKEELMHIDGIGEKKFAELENLVIIE